MRSIFVNPDYLETISDIEKIMNNYPNDIYLLGGDWNTDMSRKNAQTDCFTSFIERNNLKVCWDSLRSHIGDTFSSNDRTSCIDHFVLSDVLLHSVNKCYVEESPLIPSDHNPVILDRKYDLQITYAKPRTHGKSGIAWHRVDTFNITKYQTALDKELDDICVATGAVLCENTNCQNANHKRDIDDLCDKMIQACLKSGDLRFLKCKPYKPCNAGWNSEVKLLREDSLCWHHIWVDCGRPPAGALAQVMQSTRDKYHRAVREVKKKDEQLRRVSLAEKASSNNARDLWTELRKINGINKQTPVSFDGFDNDCDIVTNLAKKYEKRFSSNSGRSGLSDIKQMIENKIVSDNNSKFTVAVDEVTTCISALKTHKADGKRGTDSNHFIYASHKFKVFFHFYWMRCSFVGTLLRTCWLRYCHSFQRTCMAISQ